jgi:hypothetical protein
MRNSDQFQTSAAADDWPSVMLARPVKVHYRRLHSILFVFLMIFFLGMSLVILALNGFPGAGVLIVALNVILLFVLYYVLSRGRKRAACLFDSSGVTRGDGRRFSWSEFESVDYLMAVKPPSGEEYLWRIELAFTGGNAWIIPQRVNNLDEINEVVNRLPGEHRKRELLSLRWQNVDFERDVIHVMNSRRERTKSGRSRSVPLTSIAREELLELHKESGWSEYVFVNSKTFQPLTDVKKAFTSALRKAGIVDFHFHDLRHTCATRLGDRGASAFEIAQIMGWSDIRMAMRYTHATGEGIRRAMQLLTKAGVGKGNGKVLQLENWTDTKVPTSNGNGQHALPVSA